MKEKIALLACAYVGFMSLLTFILYAVDKRRAVKKQWRLSEGLLLGCSVLGGAIGGFLAMQLVRHKTKHWYFVVVNLCFAVAHGIGLIWLIKEWVY